MRLLLTLGWEGSAGVMILEGPPPGFRGKGDNSKMADSKKSLLSWNFFLHIQ